MRTASVMQSTLELPEALLASAGRQSALHSGVNVSRLGFLDS